MGPPPRGPGRPGPGEGWTPQRRRVGPSAGWYALPIALVLVAVIGFATVLAFLWDDSEVAGGPAAVGDPASGVTVRLTEGYGYFVYVREGGPSPYACRVEAGERSGPVQLTRKNSWSASDHASYRYTATFRAPVSGDARLTCRGAEGPILVTPDDTADGYLGLSLLTALGLGGLAAVAFIVTILRRSGAGRRAVTAEGPYY
ncbi:hypothetical protein BKA00_000787 [Actinomadura coerulea]|uniref:Serine/arginine repetitive matrix protein 2 n=1 Tax=Actinomadura coerulea TaxID=46159 RepID=A0A7X0KX16_9ACTN|nr:hypothetical protein [Actinomadura coerulea]MBB6393873.1 hypothetical protein [Actinomadura coerulea]